jgi:hypothetical protein
MLLATALFLALTGEADAVTHCQDVAGARRCVTLQDGQIASICVTSGVTRTCTHYRDGRPVRSCVRIGGRNRCHDPAVRIAWSGVRAASGQR